MRLPMALFRDRIKLSRYDGHTALGPTDEHERTYPAYVEYKRRKVTTGNGEVKVSDATVLVRHDTPVDVGDLVELPNGKPVAVMTVIEHRSVIGSGLTHKELDVGPRDA